ncbi:MAG TPA: adenylate/guanylate cyclase domain-containing protein [Candidatus Nitrosotalea sp.]|jgi:adenylate cyclase|nr:adenylate/guanylate cyclase domain-containing protein [Candidatus Nitrosotalea sp.]
MRRHTSNEGTRFAPPPETPVLELIAWLSGSDARDLDESALLPLLGEKLRGLPVKLDCIALYLRDLHPEIRARLILWSPGTAPKLLDRAHGMQHIIDFPASPVGIAMATQTWQAATLAPDGTGFDELALFRERDMSCLLVAPLRGHDGLASAIIFAARGPRSFAPVERNMLEQILPALSTAFELRQLRRVGASLLDTYVGPVTGRRILAGRIKQGDVESIEAALLLCDLRDFTRLSNRLAPDVVFGLLNRYFDQVVPEITRHGGEVVKFIGDAVLAFFPGDTGPATSSAAFRAAQGIQERLDACPSAISPEGTALPLRAGVALHHGKINYGNIGSGRRLDFTVIGRDVNLLSRVQGVAGSHGYPILMSGDFAQHLGSADQRSAGSFALRGFADPVELFVPGSQLP